MPKSISSAYPAKSGRATVYAQLNPSNTWDDFRNNNQGDDYKQVKTLVFKEQGGLCAFCETKIDETHKQRLEHYHPKSDKSNANHNWALDWQNVIGVCLGGSDVDKTKHPLPSNLSCDAYKDHLIKKNKLPEACEGYLFNPLEIVTFPCLFNFDKRTGELKPKDNYENIEIENNHYYTISELVAKTIEYLNLNCDRLNQDRLVLLNEYNKQIKKARETNDKDIFKKLTKHWLEKREEKWLRYFTTRRILLEHHAENHLNAINYQG